MSTKLMLAASVGLVGATVTIVKKLDAVTKRLDTLEERLDNVRREKSLWNDFKDPFWDMAQSLERVAPSLGKNKKKAQSTKRKVAFSAAKSVGKVAGRAAWNKITRKDK